MHFSKILLLTSILLLSACTSTKDIAYFQTSQIETELVVAKPTEIRIQPNEQLSIIVSSKRPDLAALFNLPVASYKVGDPGRTSYSVETALYTVNEDGNILFPTLGEVQIANKTRKEVVEIISNKLKESGMITDAIVTVEFKNLTVSVLGEVNKPGQYAITRNYLTIFDALGMASDLTIYGVRNPIYVVRNVNNIKQTYELDLTSDQIFTSPAYYLQQNDVVYVKPNKMRERQSTVNGNNWSSVTFWMSIISLLSTTMLFFK